MNHEPTLFQRLVLTLKVNANAPVLLPKQAWSVSLTESNPDWSCGVLHTPVCVRKVPSNVAMFCIKFTACVSCEIQTIFACHAGKKCREALITAENPIIHILQCFQAWGTKCHLQEGTIRSSNLCGTCELYYKYNLSRGFSYKPDCPNDQVQLLIT